MIDMELLVGFPQMDPARMKAQSLCNAGEESKALPRISGKVRRHAQADRKVIRTRAVWRATFYHDAAAKSVARSAEELDFLPFYVSGCRNMRRVFQAERRLAAAAPPQLPIEEALA
ncbi:hypothetical protein [Rhizobium sp. SGZ-381]|uniref:hypothetical protein n=1 Tax=Rhizobium sp. SGZ-381 TaxID=3342800 RepID=UPI00366BBB14